MEWLIEFIKGFSLQEIITIFGVIYFTTNNKFKKIQEDLNLIKIDIKNMDSRLKGGLKKEAIGNPEKKNQENNMLTIILILVSLMFLEMCFN